MQIASFLRRVMLSSVACLALSHFSTLYHKRHHFRGNKILNIKCVFWFSVKLLSETFPILRRSQRDIIMNVHRSSCKVPVIFVRFQSNWIFSTYFRKILKYQISLKSVQWEQSCFKRKTHGRTDMTKLIVAARNFGNAPRNVITKWAKKASFISLVHGILHHIFYCWRVIKYLFH